MNKRARRRIQNGALFVLLATLAVVANQILNVLHYRTPFFSGWFLFGLIVVLALYNVRKKLALIPVGTSAGWLQFHLYAGIMTSVVFALHVGLRIPDGVFERTLAVFYVATFTSGVAGLFLSRTFPARITSRGEEILFERIPVFLKQLRDDVEKVVFTCVEQTETTAIPELYLSHLKPFFEKPRNVFWHLVHSGRPRQRLLLEIRGQQRFLSESERKAVDQVTDRVRTKDDLDYQYALQGTLKVWLFIHIPLTYGLLVMSIFHGLAVYAYGGSY
ncbi:MAG: hypothetical protein O3B13_16230 [Planctomycetota bacterium]|nr:hypothetical protein [Planctomycetota bacterium]